MAGKGVRSATDAESQDPNNVNPGSRSQSRPSRDADIQRTAAPAGASIRPSMLLLLGILHFACRWIRSGLVANDILNMVRDGKLPWFCAWQRLPESLRSPVSLVADFFRPRMLPKSPASLTFLAENFAVCIGCRLPPINSLVVATHAVAAMFPLAQAEPILENFRAMSIIRGGVEAASEAHVFALVVLAAATHQLKVGGPPLDIYLPTPGIPWSERELQGFRRDKLQEFVAFHRSMSSSSNVPSRMHDTCEILRAWGEEVDARVDVGSNLDDTREHDPRSSPASEDRTLARFRELTGSSSVQAQYALLVERAAQHLECDPGTLWDIMDEHAKAIVRTTPAQSPQPQRASKRKEASLGELRGF